MISRSCVKSKLYIYLEHIKLIMQKLEKNIKVPKETFPRLFALGKLP